MFCQDCQLIGLHVVDTVFAGMSTSVTFIIRGEQYCRHSMSFGMRDVRRKLEGRNFDQEMLSMHAGVIKAVVHNHTLRDLL